MDADGSLELNIVSAPAPPQPARKKRRSSGKAWDKKKTKSRPQIEGSSAEAGISIDTTRTVRDASGIDTSGEPGTDRGRKSAGKGVSDAGGAVPVANLSKPQAEAIGSEHGSGKVLFSTKSLKQKRSEIESGAVVAGGASADSRGKQNAQPSAAPKFRAPKLRHHRESNSAAGIGPGTTPTKEPSHERRRVLEMAGRTTPKTDPTRQQHKQHNGSRSKEASQEQSPGQKVSATSVARSAKRQRPSAPVTSDGVVDFTVGNAENDKPRSDRSIRKAAATAAAVAKATAKMDDAGGNKWWDDDDDDYVAQAIKKPPAAQGGQFNWRYGNGAAEEKEEDKDGGLPSDIHPNSVRTKAVDMDAEASNAMGILATLMGSGSGKSGAVESKRLKNGGKSKKRAREDAATAAADVESSASMAEGGDTSVLTNGQSNSQNAVLSTTSAGSASMTEGGDTSVPTNGQSNSQNDVLSTTSGGKLVSEGQEPFLSAMDIASDHASSAEQTLDTTAPLHEEKKCHSDNPRGDVQERENNGVQNAQHSSATITRKTRGKHENGDGIRHSDSVPLPEHHARPRELSRRAAAAPLPSARSAHVMAAGPGATFAALGMPPKMVAYLEEPKGEQGGGGMGLAGPTVCQLAAVPVLVAGHNAVIKSETGSGKTLAYLLPLLCDLAAMKPKVEREKGTLAIVLAPTRELSAQILEVLTRAVRPFIWLVPGSISGGERRKSEKARLRKGVTVLVCTPGRLLDHLKTTQCFRRDSLRWLVLDEADRLLDMGFEKQVKEIVELLDQSARAVRAGPAGANRGQGGAVTPSVKVIRRQTVMVSATINKGVSRMASILLSKHMRVDADGNFVESVHESGEATLISGTREQNNSARADSRTAVIHGADGAAGIGIGVTTELFSTPRQLIQHYMTVTQKLRLPALCAFLRTRARNKVVVFMSTCDAVDFHHGLFCRANWPGDAVIAGGGAGGRT